ncbi:MAG: VTT domain-containing protein [Rhodospirillaceae bacterium]
MASRLQTHDTSRDVAAQADEALLIGSHRSPGTLFELGRNCRAIATTPRVALLVDAEDYYSAFMRAALRAHHSIVILAWDFDSRARLRWDDAEGPPPLLGDFLNFLVKRRRALEVYILNWDYPMVYGTDREFPPIYGLGSWTPRRRVHFEYDNTQPIGGSHHQKIVVIDDAMAFSGGLDLTGRRWDTCEHKAHDPRRVVGQKPYPPFHDIMIAVDGDAARALGKIARERWERATVKAISPAARGSDPWPDDLEVQVRNAPTAISCTFPDIEPHHGAQEIEALYLDMIARARRSIYIENQYFTADKIGNALAARLAEPDGPEIVVVSRLLSHGWLEEHTMHVLRTELVRRLRDADKYGRFEIYYPHVPGLEQGTCVDVHSKMMIVDDEWLRIGSANLCNRSMGLDTECDVTLEARGDPAIARAIVGFRNRLLAEHLDVEAARVEAEVSRSGALIKAINALHSDGRTLRRLDGMPEWPDAVITAAQVADPEKPVSLDQLVEEFSPEMDREQRGPAWGKLAAIALAIVALTALWRYTPLAEVITADRIAAWADEFGRVPWAPLVVMAAYTPASIVMFPRPLITLFAVIAFGPWLGWVTAMSGILLAALAVYWVGRMMRRGTVRRLAGHSVNRISEVLRRRGLVAMTALRLVPIAPFSVESLVAGALRLRARDLLGGTFLGMLPGTLAATVFGDQLHAALNDPESVNYWLIAGVVLVFAIGMLAVRRWFKRQIAKHADHPAR